MLKFLNWVTGFSVTSNWTYNIFYGYKITAHLGNAVEYHRMKDNIICHVTHIVYLEGQVVTMKRFFKSLNYFLFNFFFEGELSLLVWFQFSEDTINFIWVDNFQTTLLKVGRIFRAHLVVNISWSLQTEALYSLLSSMCEM